MSDLNFSAKGQDANFEIVVLERDKNGLPTGRKIRYSSDSASEIWDFHHTHESTQKAKRKKKRKKKKKKKNGEN